MVTSDQIGAWYDGFAGRQVKTDVNLRHYRIMEYLIRAGLKKNHKVLEIGCGIGTLTGLLIKYLRNGKVVAVDISRESVEIARKRLSSKSNVSFIVNDMTGFSHPDLFDFIVLADVLEHIPESQHSDLFMTISEHMHDNSVILIHIPHPKALDFIRRNSPGQLQIIDQSISADKLLGNVYANNLILRDYRSYPLFDRKNDYAAITLVKNTEIELSPLPRRIIIIRKALARLRFFLSRI